MKYRKLTLISPPLDQGKERCIDTGYWMPLNLLALASYMRENGYAGEIQILDYQVLHRDEIVNNMRAFGPDLVGISPNFDTYKQTIELAELAKKLGADVVLGGSYATENAGNILRNRDFVDYVIARDGEVPLLSLAEGRTLSKINNLVFRDHGKVVHNDVEYHHRASYTDVDYSSIVLDPYFDNYRISPNPGIYKRPFTFMTQRGCVWREKSGGCIFCSRIEPYARFDNIHDVWRRIGNLRERYGMDSFLDVSDDFLGNQDWFHTFYRTRPAEHRDLGIRFLYSRVNHITARNADILADLHAQEVCFGLESGDRTILKNTVKGSSPEQQLDAVRLMEERNINLIVAYMVGLPGETEDSIKNTYDQARRILECRNINELLVAILIPLPGSAAYKMLLDADDSCRRKYMHRDVVNVREMQQDWVSRFCNIDFELIEDYAHKINNLSTKVHLEMV